ncbi:MAG: DUF2163 domain-containing protein [Xenococcus sp. (in: cyanobacteria)]
MAHFNSIVSTLTYVVKIARSDGLLIGLTSFNHDLVIDDLTYQANSAIDPTAVAQKTNLSTDNIEVKALVENNLIAAEDLLAGLFDNAEVTCALVDFLELPNFITNGIVLLTGRVGEIEVQDNFYKFEIRSLSETISRPLNNKTSPICSHSLGDHKCGKDLVISGLFLSNVIVNFQFANTLSLSQGISVLYENGTIRFTSGANQGKIYEIIAVDGNKITLANTPSALVVTGDTIELTGYCAKTAQACIAHNNYINFGGFPISGHWIPGLSKITIVN